LNFTPKFSESFDLRWYCLTILILINRLLAFLVVRFVTTSHKLLMISLLLIFIIPSPFITPFFEAFPIILAFPANSEFELDF